MTSDNKPRPYITDELNKRLDAVTRWYGEALENCHTLSDISNAEVERRKRNREIMTWYNGEVAIVEDMQREYDDYWQRWQRDQNDDALD